MENNILIQHRLKMAIKVIQRKGPNKKRAERAMRAYERLVKTDEPATT